MYCKHCGAENSDNAAFCIKCGSKLTHISATNHSPKKKSKKVFIAIPIVIALAVLIIVGVKLFEGDKDTEEEPIATESLPQENNAIIDEPLEEAPTSIRAMYPYSFSEGYAWIETKLGEQISVIDTTGNVVFTVDNESNAIKDLGRDYPILEATPFYDGASAVRPTHHLGEDWCGLAIYDTKGNLLFSSDDGDDSTRYSLLAAGDGLYLIVKYSGHENSGNSVLYCIDKNGNKKTDEILVPNDIGVSGWNYIGNGNFVRGTENEYTESFINGKYSQGINDVWKATEMDDESFGRAVAAYCGEFFPIDGYNNELFDILLTHQEIVGSDTYSAFLNNDIIPGWYNSDFQLVLRAPAFSGLELYKLSSFVGDYAYIILKDADDLAYFTLIDKSGKTLYAPVGGKKLLSYSTGNLDVSVCFSPKGIIAFEEADAAGERTVFIIDKDGSLYDASKDISGFSKSVNWFHGTYNIEINQGFKYLHDESLMYRKLDGNPVQVTFGSNVTNVKFTQGYKKRVGQM